MNQALSEFLTTQFYIWEQRGRGWSLFDQPVELESEFVPFFGHLPPELPENAFDDGRRPRFFPSLQQRTGLFNKSPSDDYSEAAYDALDKMYPLDAYVYQGAENLTELQVHFSSDTRIEFERIEQLLLMISSDNHIVGFEMMSTSKELIIQFVCPVNKAGSISSLISTYAPGVVVHKKNDNLLRSINLDHKVCICDLGLRDEFMRPLKIWPKLDPDPLTGCIAVLEGMKENEFGMLQVLFQGAVNPWAESIYRSVTNGTGDSFFADSPEMLPLAKEKISSPLFATVIRTVGQAEATDEACLISNKLAQSLLSFHRSGSNTLIPLDGDLNYTKDDILLRRSRRIGMLLNGNELSSIVHVPDKSVVTPKLRAYVGKTKPIPAELEDHDFELGQNEHLGQLKAVTVSDQHRLRHMHLIGATGTGKSSLLVRLIVQDVVQGKGLTVLDPHGDLIDEVIRHLPDDKLDQVVLVDPSDVEYPIGLNLLSAQTEAEKIILSSDLVALFRRFATSWGDQMTSVLSNAIIAILESRNGGTLIDLRRFLVEERFRNKFLQTVDDPNVVYYWKKEFPILRKNTVAPILTRLDTFLRPRIVRNMMAQRDGLDFTDIIRGKKILLVKLAQGLIGEENSYLLGTLLVAKLHQAAQARQNIPREQRHPHYFYIDEFQNFITPSMSAILSGARKYGLGLILAHQDLEQLARKDSELANSVMSNPSIRVCFRCGDKDASRLEEGFSYFDSTDLQSLPVGHAIARVGRKDFDFNLSFELLKEVSVDKVEVNQSKIVTLSRSIYGKERQLVEMILGEALDSVQSLNDEDNSSHSNPSKEGIAESPEDSSRTTEVTTQENPHKSLEVEAQKFVEREIKKEEKREHCYLQEFVKKIAEARGFKAILEESVLGGDGMVDVGLIRDHLRIACEISVTNTPEYEVQNIQKCFVEGYQMVFMISNAEKHLAAIRGKAIETIDRDLHERLFFSTQDEFVNQLDLILSRLANPIETRTRGYRVKVNYSDTPKTPEQRCALKDVIISSYKRKQGKNREND